MKKIHNPSKLLKNKLSTDILPNPTQILNTDILPNPLELANTLVENSLLEPLEVVNTLVSESLPDPLEVANTLVAESLPDPLEVVNTLVENSLPIEVVNTLVTESLPDPLEVANTLVSESLPDPLEVVNTLVAESLPDPLEVANTLVSESLPIEVVNTLVAESLPIEVANILVAESLPIEVVNTLVENSLPIEVANTLVTELSNPIISESFPESTVNTIMIETLPNSFIEINTESTNVVNTLPSPFDAIYKKSKPTFRIQLPTFKDVKNEMKNEVKNEMKNENNEDNEKNQDSIQKLAVVSTLVLELYRMLTSSLLILFVPQSCGGTLCSISDNLTWNPDHHQYNFGICVNFITLFIFSCLYAIELKRENRLIKYLHVNPEMPSSNDAVEKTLEHIDIEKKRKILSIDKQYQRISYCSIGMYAFNSIVSGVIISHYYFGSQTTTSFITSLLFMFTKLVNVYQVSNTEENIFYSGYMKTFVQFNDLDETHKIPDNL